MHWKFASKSIHANDWNSSVENKSTFPEQRTQTSRLHFTYIRPTNSQHRIRPGNQLYVACTPSFFPNVQAPAGIAMWRSPGTLEIDSGCLLEWKHQLPFLVIGSCFMNFDESPTLQDNGWLVLLPEFLTVRAIVPDLWAMMHESIGWPGQPASPQWNAMMCSAQLLSGSIVVQSGHNWYTILVVIHNTPGLVASILMHGNMNAKGGEIGCARDWVGKRLAISEWKLFRAGH